MKTRTLAPLCLFFILAGVVLSQPPAPLGIAGFIFQSDGTTQVPLGTKYTINNTASGHFIAGKTSNPVPGLTGRYFETINGSDGDTVVLTAWNSTHYNITTIALLGTMDNVNLTFNQLRPPEVHLAILIPLNYTTVTTSQDINVTVNITAVGGSDSMWCNITLSVSQEDVLNMSDTDNWTHRIGTVPLGTSVFDVFNFTGHAEGLTNITASVVCDSDLKIFDGYTTQTVYDINVQDTTPPIVRLEAPKNYTWVGTENITFYYNLTDATGVDNCTLYFDGSPVDNSTSVTTEVTQTLSVYQASDDNHTWMVRCFDNSTQANQGDSDTWIVRVDTQPPDVTPIWPGDNYMSVGNNITFKYSVTDAFDMANCSLILDDSIDQTNYTIEEAVTQSFNRSFKAGGYSWQVNCTDLAGNVGSFTPRIINITDPDLEILVSDMFVSSQLPVEGQQVLINVTVHNRGDENASQVLIKLFELTPEYVLNEIGSTTEDIPAHTNISFETYWTARIGDYRMIAEADPPISANGSIREWDESNNRANRTIFVNIWQVFYGHMNSELVLEDEDNATVARWDNIADIIGNIYVVDSDASISWGTLQALSRNTTNHSRLDDFEEIDITLNTTYYNDSINRTYRYGAGLRGVRSFRIFDTNISDVPVINTTNTSLFVTGILWDYSDLAIGNYNGTQDVVFIGTASSDTVGSYGIYDYELRIPANLREYTKPNDENTVTFYTELL
jgi:hypothetical protein